MSINKTNILKRLGDFMDTILTDVKLAEAPVDLTNSYPILLKDKSELFIVGAKAYNKDGTPFVDGSYETVARVNEFKSVLIIKDGIQIESQDTNINKIAMAEDITKLAVTDPSTGSVVVVEAPFKVGEALPDGEYEINGNTVKITKGLVEAVTPSMMDSAEELAAKEKVKTDAAAEQLSAQVNLKADFDKQIQEVKDAFEVKLTALAEANKTSGIIQAPVDKIEAVKVLTVKEQIIAEHQYKKNNK